MNSRLRRCPRLVPLLVFAMALFACSGNDKPSSGGEPGGGAAQPAGESRTGGAARTAQLAMVRDQRVMVRGADGQEQMLTRSANDTFPAFPVWSPDGSRIAYVQKLAFSGRPNQDWGGDIYVLAAAGGAPQLVWKHDQTGADVQGLAWTPDGKALVMGYQATIIKDGRYQGQVTRLERLDLGDGSRTPLVNQAVFPSFSRDGKRMAYLTQDDTGQGGLWVANADASDPKRLLDLGAKFAAILGPRISPDGSAIAFAAVTQQASAPAPRDPARGGFWTAMRLPWTVHAAEAHGLPMDVWRVNVADSASTRLTNLGEDEPYSAWAPDGNTVIVFATGGLYEVNADGSNLKKLAPGAFGGQVDTK